MSVKGRRALFLARAEEAAQAARCARNPVVRDCMISVADIYRELIRQMDLRENVRQPKKRRACNAASNHKLK
jgi:hypothetical protein